MDFKNLYEYTIYKQEFCLFIGKCINFIYDRNVLFHCAMKITAQNFYDYTNHLGFSKLSL